MTLAPPEFPAAEGTPLWALRRSPKPHRTVLAARLRERNSDGPGAESAGEVRWNDRNDRSARSRVHVAPAALCGPECCRGRGVLVQRNYAGHFGSIRDSGNPNRKGE